MGTTNITVTDLRTVYTTTKNDATLAPFVVLGNMIVNEQLRVNGCSLSDDRYKAIAEYLAAHYADSSMPDSGDPAPLKSEKIGDATDTYAVPDQTQAGYMTTKYGQLAIALDTCNILVSAPKLKAKFEVVGDNHLGKLIEGFVGLDLDIGTLP